MEPVYSKTPGEYCAWLVVYPNYLKKKKLLPLCLAYLHFFPLPVVTCSNRNVLCTSAEKWLHEDYLRIACEVNFFYEVTNNNVIKHFFKIISPLLTTLIVSSSREILSIG